MLRRIAGSLFWAARYLERAQWRARLVDVNYNLLLEVPPRDVDPWEPLVRITRRTYDHNGRPIDFEYLYGRQDAFQFRIRVPRW